MSTVRAKFKVSRIESSMGSKRVASDPYAGKFEYVPVEMRTIVLQPVYANGDPAHENNRFWDATPSGEIRLGVINQAAWEAFVLDQEYYIDFTPATAVK